MEMFFTCPRYRLNTEASLTLESTFLAWSISIMFSDYIGPNIFSISKWVPWKFRFTLTLIYSKFISDLSSVLPMFIVPEFSIVSAAENIWFW